MNKANKWGAKLTESQTGFLLVLPALLVFSFIILYPFINSVMMSFTDQSLLKPDRSFVGLDNYVRLFSNPEFLGTLKNTFVFVLFGTLVPFVLGLIWAIILNQGFRGSEFLRGLTLVNWILPSTAISFLWMWIFNAHFGLFNGFLKNIGLINENITWLGQMKTAMLIVIIAKTWSTLPWFMAFLLGGLQGVSKDQIEASRIDGAGNWQVFRHVVVPEMKFVTSLVLILGFIGSLQHFDLLYVMTGGGPARATTTLSVEVYNYAFKSWRMGVSASIGTIWILLLSVLGYFYIRSQKDDLN